jgi:hypothetical protein
MEMEQELEGGNSTPVVRVGDTVRRAAGPWSPQVHRLLAHLRARGIMEAPAPLGFDEQGREIIAFIPGTVGNDPLPDALRGDDVLVAAAVLLRRIHDATADIAQEMPSGWRAPTRFPVEVICHGDFAPYNCVFEGRKLVGVIDFDYAHPGSRAWDLAYALYRFVPLMAPSNPGGYGDIREQGRRMGLFLAAYRLEDRSRMMTAVKERVATMAEFLRAGAARGDPSALANIAAGHLDIYTTDWAYLEAHGEELQAAANSEASEFIG